MYDYEFDDRKMRGTLRDWRKALRTPATYRVGNAVRVQPQFILLIMVFGFCVSTYLYYNWWTSNQPKSYTWIDSNRKYNSTYPISLPVRSGDLVTFRIGIVADLDTKSKSSTEHTYNSYLKRGYLSYNSVQGFVTVSWDNTHPTTLLTSTYSHKGRGMELSELVVFDGRLLTFDDRSGLVFEITNNRMVPWVILSDGNGHMEKGFKSEWATVKDEKLYVGSMGKEWTTSSGAFQSYDPMWIKVIDMNGVVHHLSWINEFKAVRRSLGIEWPGYLIHESGVWSHIKRKWYFLPRRCSHDSYNETKDEVMGCNCLIEADDRFDHVQAVQIVKHQPKHGFSSFKFIPDTQDEAIVALKTTEFEGQTATYISAFKTDGTTLLKDTLVDNLKFEGLEFI